MHKLRGQIQAAFGVGNDLSTGQIALRAIIINGAAVIIARLGSKRFLGRVTAFDVLVTIMNRGM